MAEYGNMTYGNLAYDPFGTSAPQIEVPEAEPQSPRPAAVPRENPAELQRVRLKEEEAARTAARDRKSMTAYLMMTVPAVIVCAVLMITLLRAHTRLTALSAESAALESRISELKTERKRLEVQSESAFNMEEVEQTARSVIGMVKPETEQFVYLHNTAENVAVIMTGEAGEKSGTDWMSAFAKKVKAYFTQLGS